MNLIHLVDVPNQYNINICLSIATFLKIRRRHPIHAYSFLLLGVLVVSVKKCAFFKCDKNKQKTQYLKRQTIKHDGLMSVLEV